MQYAVFLSFQHALIASQQYASVIKNSNFYFLEGMNLKWAQKERIRRMYCNVILFPGTDRNLCEPCNCSWFKCNLQPQTLITGGKW